MVGVAIAVVVVASVVVVVVTGTAVDVVVVKVAVTLSAASIVTTQVVLAPAHAPDQCENVEPDAGASVSVTVCPVSNEPTPESKPAGDEVTVPVPLPP
jgi:hypothetical protein